MGKETEESMLILRLLVWSSFLVFAVTGKTHEYDFVVGRSNYTRLCETKSIMTVNGQYPGPTLYVHRGDLVIIHAYNKADHNVTLHWHGLKQPRDPWHDGPEFITQCPIKPGGKFKYRLNFTTEEGTIWWHAHSDWTRATVHGAIFIYPPRGHGWPFEKPHLEVPLILGEWWKREIFDVLDDALTYGGEPNISNSYTINGQPGDLMPCSKNGTFRFTVKHGETYLLRIINAALQDELFFAVANHNITVVGEDGSYCKPITTSYIMITPGQSYDVLLNATQTPNLYYLAMRAYSSGQGVGYDNTTATAILQYETYKQNTTPILPNLPEHNDTDAAIRFVTRLRSIASPDHPADVPVTVDRHLIYSVSVNILSCPNDSCEGPNGSRLSASINNISFQNPSIDILGAYYFGINGVFKRNFPSKPPYVYNFTADDFPENVLMPHLGTKVKVLKYNSNVQLVLQGTNVIAGENHPVHLHGQNFFVVGIGLGNYNDSEDPKKFNLVDPPQKNTVGVLKNGWVAVRFRAQNPGVWFMHCHLERHLSWGMDAVFITKNGNTSETTVLPPPDDLLSC